MNRIIWIIPNPASFVSGGNRMNAQLIRACEELDWPHKVVSIDQWGSVEVNTEDILVFDTIYIDRLDVQMIRTCRAIKILWIHYLPSLIQRERTERERQMIEAMDGCIVNSLFMLNWLSSVYPRIQIQQLSPYVSPAKEGRNPIPGSIMMVGHWTPVKRYIEMIHAFHSVSIPPYFKVLIFGEKDLDKAYFKLCVKLIQTYELESSIHIAGPVSIDQMNKAYSTAAVFAEGSMMETYGLAVAEASLRAVPILSLGAGNLSYLLDEAAICNTHEDLVHRLIQGNYFVNKKKSIESYQINWKDFVNKFESVLQSVLAIR
jgi:glycosyltransferase involved in cell wall biosynthesis